MLRFIPSSLIKFSSSFYIRLTILGSFLFITHVRSETVIHQYDFQDENGVTQEGWTPVDKNTLAAPGIGGFVIFDTNLVYAGLTRTETSTQEPENVTTDYIHIKTTDVAGDLALQFRDYIPPNATNLSITIYTTDTTDVYSRDYQVSLSCNDDPKTKTIIWTGEQRETDSGYMGTGGYYLPITFPTFSLPDKPGTDNFVDVLFESNGSGGGVRINGIKFEYTTK